ncbi:MAG: 30S ribosomal protein S5 [Candidatus Micrarchaeota archaeon]|nr:30S ribosomal protein S5 [Candidatus Micrarchaeota archaeon]
MAEQKEWLPRTELGKKVAGGEITSIDQVFESGKKILEPQIIDVLLPDLREEVLERRSTQRMTASGRKQQMRAVVVIGNGNGYIGAGVGKAPDTRRAIAEAIVDAKKNVMKVQLGCGSWECGCGTGHSIMQRVTGRSGTTEISIKPAPRGVGIVAGKAAKKVLELAGVRDAWTFARGRTRNVLNTVLATISALESMNRLKKGAGAGAAAEAATAEKTE